MKVFNGIKLLKHVFVNVSQTIKRSNSETQFRQYKFQ